MVIVTVFVLILNKRKTTFDFLLSNCLQELKLFYVKPVNINFGDFGI